MNNFKKTLNYQQTVDEAVQAIFKHFEDEAPFSEHYEIMSKAQTDIMVMATHYRRLLEQHKDELDDTYNEDITEFMWIVSKVFKLLRPFADMLGQVYGTDIK